MADQLDIPATYDAAYPGRFLRASQLGDAKPTVTIDAVWREQLAGENGPETRVIVRLSGARKSAEYVLPKLNGVVLRALFGDRIHDWIGRRITIYATASVMPFPARGGGRPEPCVRIWGSPDIDADRSVEFRPARRRPITMLIRKTTVPPSAESPDTDAGADAEIATTDDAQEGRR